MVVNPNDGKVLNIVGQGRNRIAENNIFKDDIGVINSGKGRQRNCQLRPNHWYAPHPLKDHVCHIENGYPNSQIENPLSKF